MLLRTQFIEKLENKYGPWERATSRFGKATFGEISKDLCISPSQFSKLIYESASEASYERAIRNVQRLITTENYESEKQELLTEQKINLRQIKKLRKRLSKIQIKILLGFLILSLILIAALGFYHSTNSKPDFQFEKHPLWAYFDPPVDFHNSPYLKPNQVQDHCPASAYEGTWILDKPYKFPLPDYKPGLYYLARRADMRVSYSEIHNLTEKGKSLIGYEYLVSELWIDTKQESFVPTYFDKDTKTYTSTFQNLIFENEPRFKKVANIHTFLLSVFEIENQVVNRKGEPTGRFITDVDQDLVKTFELDLNYILRNVLDNFKQTNCEAARHAFCDPNMLEEGKSALSFNCIFTIDSENLGMGGGYPYTKTFRLIKQNYSDNLTCNCAE